MGADIYLQSVSNTKREAWQPFFDIAVKYRNSEHRDTATTRSMLAEIDRMVPDLEERIKLREYALLDPQQLVEYGYEHMYDDAGYYRDSYNSTNLLWLLDLDYWHGASLHLDDENFMPVEEMRLWREEIAARPLPHLTRDALKKMGLALDKTNTVTSWNAYFREKREKLLALIDKAIELNEPLYCSF